VRCLARLLLKSGGDLLELLDHRFLVELQAREPSLDRQLAQAIRFALLGLGDPALNVLQLLLERGPRLPRALT